jgi:hypothetical protein
MELALCPLTTPKIVAGPYVSGNFADHYIYIYIYIYIYVYIQNVPGGNVIILGGHIMGHSKQKSLFVHVSYSERFPRENYFTVQKFGFGAQYCPSLPPYCATL